MTDEREAEDTALPESDDATDVETPDADKPAGASSTSPTRRLDPTSNWLLAVALSLVVVLLVTGLSVVMYVFALRNAPRTNAEYEISVNQAAVRQDPSNVNAWSKLAYAYAASNRYQLALDTADQGRAATGSNSLLLVTADILRLSGDQKAALAAYDSAFNAISAAQAATKQKLQQENIFVPLGGDEALAPVYYGRALSKHALGDLEGAISDLRHATALSPRESNLWVTLGDYESQAGHWKEARAAYVSALTYVPGMPQAVAGLDKLKKGGH